MDSSYEVTMINNDSLCGKVDCTGREEKDKKSIISTHQMEAGDENWNKQETLKMSDIIIPTPFSDTSQKKKI